MDYICAISGKPCKDDDLIDGGDDLGDLPVNWTKITIQTRRPNPEFINLQIIKKAMIDQLNTQIDPETGEKERHLAEQAIIYQVDAQFSALEQSERMSPFLIEEQIAFVSDPDSDKEIRNIWKDIQMQLDLEIAEDEEQQDEEVTTKKSEETRDNASV